MTSRVLLFAFLITADFCGAEVSCWLTRIDDGDAKRAAFATASGPSKYDARQDDSYTLFRKGRITQGAAGATGVVATITVDRTQSFQTMMGYGAAMTDSSAWVLSRLRTMNPALYRFTMMRLFSPSEGAGFSFLRLPMGSSDYTATNNLYTYCDEPSADLRGFSIAHDLETIIPTLKVAARINPAIHILASPWSPPAWMKTSGTLTGLSKAQKAAGADNRLKPEFVSLYADYFVRFIEAYQASGVPIWGVTLQNEPQFDGAQYPCMRMNEADQIALVLALGPKLAAKKLSTKIFVHDHNWILHPDDRSEVGKDVKLDPVASVTKMFSDPVAGRYISGSAWHGYSGGISDMRRAYTTLHAAFPEKFILFTEQSGWGKKRGAWFGDIAWGMDRMWMGGPQNGCQSALQWNLVLDHHFGPTLRKDSAATAMAAVNTDRFDEVCFEREFYAMAQMSQAAPPGAKRVASTLVGVGSGLDYVAFIQPEGQTALVVFNKNKAARILRLTDGRASFIYELSGRSIVTLVW
jgi:glucosylceramidase